MKIRHLLTCLAGLCLTLQVLATHHPIADRNLTFVEVDGIVAAEAEHFVKQELTDVRAWHIISTVNAPDIEPDADPSNAADASGGAYLEILPDNRRTHDEKLIRGENFSPDPGKMAILTYRVYFSTPGRYYFWGRIYSTGPEDNGMHIGINGEWPESGQRWQTVKKKRGSGTANNARMRCTSGFPCNSTSMSIPLVARPSKSPCARMASN